MMNIIQALDSIPKLKGPLLSNIVASAHPNYNQDSNWKLYTNILEYYYPSGSSILLPEEYKLLFVLLDLQPEQLKINHL
ncbi:MAG: hypothetical protein EOO38_22660 [Cytophagaceae bacterium]|nr:MAG: hypothetical protein EOO38_22660 [Cytophagaceae bacterium]